MRPLEATQLALTSTGASKVLVAVSGGKDSLCVVDTCVRHFGADNVVGFCMTIVKGLEVEWAPIRRLERRFGIKVLDVPHYELSRLRKYCILSPYVPGSESLRILKQVDVENYLRRQTGIDWIAWGMRAADSLERNAYLKSIQGCCRKTRRVYPIWTWKKRDVLGWLRHRRIPIPAIVGGGKINGGVTLEPATLRWLREHYPADYAKVLEAFPYAGAAVFRLDEEERQAQAEAAQQGAQGDGRRHEVPEVRGASRSPKGHQGRRVQPSAH